MMVKGKTKVEIINKILEIEPGNMEVRGRLFSKSSEKLKNLYEKLQKWKGIDK